MATEILRPNATGDETALSAYPGSGEANWEDVDDVTPDEGSTYVYVLKGINTARDLYELPAHTGRGTITSIRVYYRIYGGIGLSGGYPVIKSYTTVSTAPGYEPTGAWTTHSHQWATNPHTGVAWTWADIDDLQIGIKLISSATVDACCTQVYVVVNYTLPVGPFPTHFRV